MAAYRRVDDYLIVTCVLTAVTSYTGISSAPTLGNEYGKPLQQMIGNP